LHAKSEIMEALVRCATVCPTASSFAGTVRGPLRHDVIRPRQIRHGGLWRMKGIGGSLSLLAAASLRRRRTTLRGLDKPWATSLRASSSLVETGSDAKVPVVLLSGFLGTGKTTLLRHWLENAEGRIGIVVNDVATVNIDSKLVQQRKYDSDGQIDAIQLQNGCACCSLGDELMMSIYELLELATEGEPFSQIVVELSGVAEPARVRTLFQDAEKSGSLAMEHMELGKVLTLVDASTFCKEYMEYAQIHEREDLMEEDVGEMADSQVVELLVEQVEAADVVVLNKTDLATPEQVAATRAVVASLNTKATIMEASFGKISLSSALQEVPQLQEQKPEHSHEKTCCHGHADHGDHSSSESHGHSHEHASDCSEPTCKDESHGSSHGNSNGQAETCNDPTCTDESHGHSHSQKDAATTAQERFGITSFTYTARRPFHEDRFAKALQKWPVPKQDDLGVLLASGDDAQEDHPLARVIRSKGFCWLETHPSSRMYWTHAGKDMQLRYEGLWWGAMTKDQVKLMETMAVGEYERSLREEWVDGYADRRQELVFIGQRVDEAAIRAILDGCLLTDSEMAAYKKKQDNDARELSNLWTEQREAMSNYS